MPATHTPAATVAPAPALDSNRLVVLAFYKFVRLEHYRCLRRPLLSLMQRHRIKGTILLACEGLNGTVAGDGRALQRLLQWLRRQPGLADLRCHRSFTDTPPFRRSKVKLKREIVTLGVAGIDPVQTPGSYVEPADWNALLDDPAVLVIDNRNEYEIAAGTFRHAVNPHTTRFRQFPAYVAHHLHPSRQRQVALFCTGGIRCEKSAAYLKQQGFEQVYQLQGGILNYLATVPQPQSRWQGDCFVFDDRGALAPQLNAGSYTPCRTCRQPINRPQQPGEPDGTGPVCPDCRQPSKRQGARARADRISA